MTTGCKTNHPTDEFEMTTASRVDPLCSIAVEKKILHGILRRSDRWFSSVLGRGTRHRADDALTGRNRTRLGQAERTAVVHLLSRFPSKETKGRKNSNKTYTEIRFGFTCAAATSITVTVTRRRDNITELRTSRPVLGDDDDDEHGQRVMTMVSPIGGRGRRRQTNIANRAADLRKTRRTYETCINDDHAKPRTPYGP